MSVVSSNSTKKSKLSGRKAAFVFAILAAVGVVILAFTIMSAVTAKETYYVLNTDVPARTLLQPEMISPIETSVGGTPPSALGLSDLADQYTLTSLKAGDILTDSNVGDLVGLTAGLPKDFVISSFVANPSVAAGGNIKRGDYVDIIAVVDDSEVTGQEAPAASYLLQRVLVVDATLDLDSFEAEASEESTTTGEGGEATTTDSSVGGTAARSGIPTMFTVGLSPENASIMALASQYDLFVVLSSSETAVDGVIPADVNAVVLNEIWGSPRDAGKGTDNTFGNGGTTETPNGAVEEGGEVSSPDSEPTEGATEETTQ